MQSWDQASKRFTWETFATEAPKSDRSGTAVTSTSMGKRKYPPTKYTTKSVAVGFVAEVEARVACGLVGIPSRLSPSGKVRR